MERAKFDWLVELWGAVALGLGGGYAALKAAPSLALPGAEAMTAGGLALFGLGMFAMRAVPSTRPILALPDFALEPVMADILLLDEVAEEPLLLDQPYREEPLLLDVLYEEEALLLQDALAAPPEDSRVIQLFAGQLPPIAGDFRDRIDRHLAAAPTAGMTIMPPRQPDASAALFAALDDLKRSLR